MTTISQIDKLRQCNRAQREHCIAHMVQVKSATLTSHKHPYFPLCNLFNTMLYAMNINGVHICEHRQRVCAYNICVCVRLGASFHVWWTATISIISEVFLKYLLGLLYDCVDIPCNTIRRIKNDVTRNNKKQTGIYRTITGRALVQPSRSDAPLRLDPFISSSSDPEHTRYSVSLCSGTSFAPQDTKHTHLNRSSDTVFLSFQLFVLVRAMTIKWKRFFFVIHYNRCCCDNCNLHYYR